MSDSTMFAPVAGAHDRIEVTIARDIVKHAVYAAPAVVAVAAIIEGSSGALGALCALAVVAVNFLVAAAALGWAARISTGALLGAALLSFVVRLAIITVLGLAVKQVDAVHFATFGVVLVAAHLGLLFWEMRHVSLSLAYPGLKPTAARLSADSNAADTDSTNIDKEQA